jgi:hypothetical protein
MGRQFAVALIALLCGLGAASGDTLFWSTNSGVWDTSTLNWTNAAGVATNLTDGGIDHVVFSNTNGGTISVSPNMNPASITNSATAGTNNWTGSHCSIGYYVDCGPGGLIIGPTDGKLLAIFNSQNNLPTGNGGSNAYIGATAYDDGAVRGLADGDAAAGASNSLKGLQVLQKHGLRPIILLNAHHGPRAHPAVLLHRADVGRSAGPVDQRHRAELRRAQSRDRRHLQRNRNRPGLLRNARATYA